MQTVDISKMKVMSVLIHPRTNAFLVQVTRSQGHFAYPQITKWYSVDYDSLRLNSFVKWANKLNALSVEKIVRCMKGS